MRFLQLQLRAYGPFTNTVLDLSSGRHGLHIVYGPNEAGKTSALRAIDALLFGFPVRCPDNQLHQNKDLRVGGIIQNLDGDTLEFVRRKANKSSLINPNHPQQAPFPDDVLSAFLGRIDQVRFQRVYGIGHEQLRRGGEDMKALQGLVGESLFAVTVGGAGLAKMMDELDQQAAAIFDTSKRNVRIKSDLKRYRELQNQKRESRLAVSQWKRLQEELDAANARFAEIDKETRSLEIQRERLKRLKQGLASIARRDVLLQRIEEIGQISELPPDYDVARRIQVVARLEAARKRIEQLERRLTGSDGLNDQLAAIHVPEGLLEFEDAINDLQDRRAVYVKAQSDLENLKREYQRDQRQAEQQLRQLGLGESLEEIEKLRFAPEERIRIASLASDEKSKRRLPRELENRLHEANVRWQELQKNAEALSDVDDVSDLRTAVQNALSLGDIEEKHDELVVSVDKRSADIRRRLAGLHLNVQNLQEIASIQVPRTETINRFAEQFHEVDSKLQSFDRESKQLHERIVDAQKAIDELRASGQVPTEEELARIRAKRNALWKEILSAGEVTSHSASDFEQSMADADAYSDRLRREANRVSELAQRIVERESLEEQRKLRKQWSECERANRDQLWEEWRKEWPFLTHDVILTPSEMSAWSAEFKEVHRDIRDLAELESQLQRIRQKLEKARQEILDAWKEDWPLDSDLPLSRMLQRAQEVIAKETEIRQHRDELQRQIAELESSIANLTLEKQRAERELTDWLTEWRKAMKLIGLSENATADQATSRSDRIQTLLGLVHDMDLKKCRIDEIDQDAVEFHQSVQRLARRFLDATEINAPAEEMAILLKTKLTTAKQNFELRQRLQEQIADSNAELEVQKQEAESLQTQLNQFLHQAGTDRLESLPQIEKDAQELNECRRKLDEIDQQLHELRSTSSLAEFIAEARATDLDSLTVELANVETELEKLRSERDRAVKELAECESRYAVADGRATAAEIDQQCIGLLSGMFDDARRFMELRLAHQILKKQIEAHRAENEDPLIGRASTLFSRLTCESFQGLRTDYDGDHPVIVGVRDDSIVTVEQMSDGTRDQLYLALRLAYVEKQLTAGEPMPFIVDDILVHFDDARSLATLEVLAELSDQTQVIFFSHHQHLSELASRHLSKDTCFVHQLTSHGQDVLLNR